MNRKEEEERKQFLRTGVIASAIINFSMNRPEIPVSPSDFVPGIEKEEQDLSKMSAEAAAAHVMSTFSKRTISK